MLYGYLLCIENMYSLAINYYFSEWLTKGKSSLFWRSYILTVVSQNNDDLACNNLFFMLGDFLESYDARF